ncbi:MAG: hypothetical protein LBC18_13650 [Opitutaceae bacterium]|nr:hypothetical protein [Opitutaceae bacterium]
MKNTREPTDRDEQIKEGARKVLELWALVGVFIVAVVVFYGIIFPFFSHL